MQSTFGASTTPLSYSDTVNSAVLAADVQIAILRLVQIIGVIAFIRGWLILAQSARQGSQPVIGRALTHIIGGILAINIIGTKNVIWATFGLS
jgi:intracellular multiplication protein IcmC